MKAVLAVALVAVAIVAPYVIPGIIGVAAGSLAAIAVTAAVEVGIALVSSAILGPSIPKNLASANAGRLYATLVTTEPRKIWFGPTAGGTDVRYQVYSGSNQEFYQQILCHASHQVDSIDEIWIDNEKAWTKTGGVQGRYVGWFTVTTRENATSSNGIAIDGTWTSSCTLTGCAYTYLKYKLLDPSNSSNQSPFQSGVSSRITIRGKGAFVYDPRLDSTVTGGSGSQRAGTQSTWAWDDNGSSNPALQLLFYLLGWQINGKLAVGMGLPASRIDLPSFITAANHCDETVTLAAGGSEPRYRSAGVISEGDDRSSVIENLCASMNAMLRDSGGKISLQIMLNDLATPVTTFVLDDILGGEEYDQTQPLNNYFNIARGRRVDPSDQALYQLSDYPQVALTAPDGIDRIQTVDFPFVQSNGQAQRLAKLRVKRAQYQARYTASFGANAWQVSLGNIVQLTHAGMNWTTKLFRVVGQAINQNGQVKMTLLEESTDVYSWSNEDVAGVVAGTPTVVNPAQLPLSSGLNAAGNSAAVGDGNRVRFSRMESGTLGWTVVDNTSSLAVTLNAGTANGKNHIVLGAPFTANSQSVGFGVSVVDGYTIPITGGERIFAGAGIGTTMTAPAYCQLELGFLDSTGAEIAGTRQVIGTGTGSVAYNTKEGGFYTAPSTATAAFLYLYVFSSTAGAQSAAAYLIEPIVCSAGASQTLWPSFSPGPSAEPGADVTSAITGSATITINADYQGNVTTALPFQQQYSLMRNGSDVSSSATWSVAVNSGTLSATMSGTTLGQLNINASSGTLTSGSVTITAVYNGTTRSFVVKVNKVNAPAPTSGSGGGTSTTQNINYSPSSTTLTANGIEIDCNSGTSAKVALSADYTFTATGANSVTMQWYRWNGSAWVAIGTAVTSPSYAKVPGDPVEFTNAYTATSTDGVTASSAQRFMLYMKEANTSSPVTGSGTQSGVGS